MRFKAPKGQGAPILRGTLLAAAKDGTYQVTDPADIDAMRSLGFLDADAPAAPGSSTTAANPALRRAVHGALKALGTAVPDGAGEDVLIKALADLPAAVETQRLAEVKAAEDAVLKQLADKSDSKKS